MGACTSRGLCAALGGELHEADVLHAAVRTVVQLVCVAAVALFVFGGNACTNASLNYLSYPLRVMFKSSKLLPVMLMSQFYLRRRYSAAQYANCIVLISAIVLFSWGDSSSDGASLQVRGLILISLGVFFDALTVSEPPNFFSSFAHLISVFFFLRNPRGVMVYARLYI